MSDSVKDAEFHDIVSDDSPLEWEEAEEHPEGVTERILYQADKTQARLLRYPPGSETFETLSHDHYEQSYIIEGDLIDKGLDETFYEGYYAFRTPGMEHGPFATETGCLTLDIRFESVE